MVYEEQILAYYSLGNTVIDNKLVMCVFQYIATRRLKTMCQYQLLPPRMLVIHKLQITNSYWLVSLRCSYCSCVFFQMLGYCPKQLIQDIVQGNIENSQRIPYNQEINDQQTTLVAVCETICYWLGIIYTSLRHRCLWYTYIQAFRVHLKATIRS